VAFAHDADGGSNRVLEGHVGKGQRKRLPVADREVDDGLDDPVEVACSHLDVSQRVELGRVLPDLPAHLDQIAEPENRGQRRAQLVLHGRHEIRLHRVELAQAPDRLLLQLVEVRILHGNRRVVGKDGENTHDIVVRGRDLRRRRHRERTDHLAAERHRQHQQRAESLSHPRDAAPGDHLGHLLPALERGEPGDMRIDHPNGQVLSLTQRDRRRRPGARDRRRRADHLALQGRDATGGAGQGARHRANSIHRAFDRGMRVSSALHASIIRRGSP
jgi:hypothetical protein